MTTITQSYPAKPQADLSQAIILLHECGYSADFFLKAGHLHSPSAPDSFPLVYTRVTYRSSYWDVMEEEHKYIYTVETDTGLKGIILTEKDLHREGALVN